MNIQKIFIAAAIAATLISSAAFAESGSKLSAFDGIPSEAVQANELDSVSGQGFFASLRNFFKPAPKPTPKPARGSITNGAKIYVKEI